MLKIFLLSVVQTILPNCVYCGSTHQGFVMKFHLFFFLIIKVFSHAYLDLSQLFESGQQFSLWNKNMVGINPIRVQ